MQKKDEYISNGNNWLSENENLFCYEVVLLDRTFLAISEL